MLTSTELTVRLGFFLGLLILFAVLEAAFPRRTRVLPRFGRWFSNLTISGINQLLTRLILPASAMVVAAFAEDRGWGILHSIDAPVFLEIALAVLLLDLAIYGQHVLFHAVPFLWRLHRMHHADTDFDVTTGIRFHPLSILISAVIKLVAVVVIGASPLAVLVFEVLLNATSLFNHSNLALPLGLDRLVRLFVVTPDMHRVHHSSNPEETDRNFGFNFPWWDRLFGTYLPQPSLGHVDMEVGLSEFREPVEQRLDRLLTQPFRS